MKKALKRIGLVLLLLVVALIGWVAMQFNSMPEGQEGPKAEEVAQKMLESVNYKAYRKIKSISWTFRDKSHHEWNKKARTDRVRWQEFEVLLDFKTGDHSVKKGGQEFSNAQLIEMAIAHFYNDSFWLAAPFKVMDKAATRKLVELDDGVGLLITYNSGGVTPGDSYLWILDENYRPKAWRLWTSNTSIKGIELGWTDWQQHGGAWFAPIHPGSGPISIKITNLKVN